MVFSRTRRKFTWLSLLFFLGVFNLIHRIQSLAAVDLGIASSTRRGYRIPPQRIAVMGQLLQQDGSATPILDRRIDKAVEVFKEGQNRWPIICSGGDPHQRGLTEAGVMRRMLIDRGVPARFVEEEAESSNTLQNALNVLRMVPTSTEAIHLVTSDFHMPRCAYLYEAAMEALGSSNIRLQLHPVTGGSPAQGQTVLNDESDGKHETVNDMTLVQRLQLEKSFLDNIAVHLRKDSHPGLKVNELPAQRLKLAQAEIARMLYEAEKE